MKKDESVLNLLMYLFENHMQDNGQMTMLAETLQQELAEAGFKQQVINEAINWLENLSRQKAVPHCRDMSAQAFRVLHEREMKLLGKENYGFLLYLEQQNIITTATREIIINQVLDLSAEGIDLGLVKWVTLLVLFHLPDHANALSCMEFLILDDTTIGGIH